MDFVGIIVTLLVAFIVYWICLALHLPAILALIAALLVIVVGISRRV